MTGILIDLFGSIDFSREEGVWPGRGKDAGSPGDKGGKSGEGGVKYLKFDQVAVEVIDHYGMLIAANITIFIPVVIWRTRQLV